MSFLVDENEFGDAPDGNENNPCESKIPILISNVSDYFILTICILTLNK